MFKRNELPYRKSTLAMVTDRLGRFLVVNKMTYEPNKYWSFPGGGVDEGETAKEAVKRELIEELESDKFEILGKSKHAYKYEWPDDVVEATYKKNGKYFRGTQLPQFWVKFTGKTNEVKAGDGIRFVKWVTREELKNHLLFPNQLENAEKVILEFTK